ncbi:MAG: PEGA domain-containing protein [Deltaproteobacteria bacterium]|nr:PEGA domain-containing protein [Deltaproteobacteria bacterium]
MAVRTTLSGLVVMAVALALLIPAQADARGRRRSAKGSLVIQSMLDGAKVYVDGKLIGKTPFDKPVQLRPGKHKLKATKPGFSTLELDFTIRPRRKLDMMVDLIPYSGLVKFSCNVDKAEVYVDGNFLGRTPLIQDVPVGDHKVQIVLEGHNDFITEINVKAGEKHFVEGVLTTYKDFSPEVLAMQAEAKRKAEEEKKAADALLAEQAKKDKEEQLAAAPAWYDEWYKQWWIWTVAGAVLVTVVTVPLAVSSGGEQSGLNAHEPGATIHLGP